MARFGHIHDMQTHASRIVAQLTGADAGFLTASASAWITLAVAGTMTGRDPRTDRGTAKIARSEKQSRHAAWASVPLRRADEHSD